MIIKSMSRKVPSFDQLINYMDAGASGRDFNIYYNLYTRQAESIEEEFMSNSQYLKRRKNGVFMYHEVISITRSEQLTETQQIEVLRNVVYKYIQGRAERNLVYGVLHDEKADNLHYHLLISSNHAESSQRHRLDKASFDKVKRNLELYVLECHPELEQDKLISKDRKQRTTQEKEAISNRGVEMQRRTGKVPHRDRVKANLERIFAAAVSREQLIELLESERLQLYKRGKHWGVLDESTKRKHRFATLGVAETFNALDARLSTVVETNRTRSEKTEHADPKVDPQSSSKQSKQQQSKKAPETDKTESAQQRSSNKETPKAQASEEKFDSVSDEQSSREAEMKAIREEKAKRKAERKKQR